MRAKAEATQLLLRAYIEPMDGVVILIRVSPGGDVGIAATGPEGGPLPGDVLAGILIRTGEHVLMHNPPAHHVASLNRDGSIKKGGDA